MAGSINLFEWYNILKCIGLNFIKNSSNLLLDFSVPQAGNNLSAAASASASAQFQQRVQQILQQKQQLQNQIRQFQQQVEQQLSSAQLGPLQELPPTEPNSPLASPDVLRFKPITPSGTPPESNRIAIEGEEIQPPQRQGTKRTQKQVRAEKRSIDEVMNYEIELPELGELNISLPNFGGLPYSSQRMPQVDLFFNHLYFAVRYNKFIKMYKCGKT